MMPETEIPASYEAHGAKFTTTHWSVVLAAGDGDSAVSLKALDRLCQKYWYPVYAYVRRRDNSPADAEDITQEFFARLIQRNDFAHLRPDRGRFRAFLFAALNHLLSDQRDRARAEKRGGGKVILSLDAQSAEQRYQIEPVDALTPEEVYDRQWALTVLEKARGRLRAEYAARGKGKLYELLKFLEPGATETLSYVEVGKRLGKTESAIKTEAFRLRQRYGQLVRAEIAQTVSAVADLDEEVRYLLTVVGG